MAAPMQLVVSSVTGELVTMLAIKFQSMPVIKVINTSWDELSSHQAEAVSLNLASSYGYITYINHFYHLHQQCLGVPEGPGRGGWGAQIKNLFFTNFLSIFGSLKQFWFLSLHQQFWGVYKLQNLILTNFLDIIWKFFVFYPKSHFDKLSRHFRQFEKN